MKPRTSYPTTEQILKGAQEKGLDPLPAEALFHYILQEGDQMKIGDWVIAGMKPVTVPGGYPKVFYAERDHDGLWLSGYWAGLDNGWYPGLRFAFSLRK